jgi:hypothetical protein
MEVREAETEVSHKDFMGNALMVEMLCFIDMNGGSTVYLHRTVTNLYI